MPSSNNRDYTAVMEDKSVSRFGLANFLAAHFIVIAAIGFWALTTDSITVGGLPAGVWVMLLGVVVVWIQFWYFIQNSELRLEKSVEEGE